MKLLKKIFLLMLVVSVLFVSCGNNEIKNPGDGNTPGTDVPGTDPVKPDTVTSRVEYKITPVADASRYIIYMDGKLTANVENTDSLISLEGSVGVHSIYVKVLNADGSVIAEWFDDVEYDGVDRNVSINPTQSSDIKIFVRNAVGEPYKATGKALFGVSDETIMIDSRTGHFTVQAVFMDFVPNDQNMKERGSMPISPDQPVAFVATGTVSYPEEKVVLSGTDNFGKKYEKVFSRNGGNLFDEKQNVYSPIIGEKGTGLIDSKWQFAPIYASKSVLNQLLEAVKQITDPEGESFTDVFPSIQEIASLPEDLVIYATLEMTSTGMNYLFEVTPKADLINGTISLKGAVKFSVHIKTVDQFLEENGKVFVELPVNGKTIVCNYSLMDGADGGVAILSIPVDEEGNSFKVPFRRVNVEYPVLDKHAFTSTKTLSMAENAKNFVAVVKKTGIEDDLTNNIQLSTIGSLSNDGVVKRVNVIGAWNPVGENLDPRLSTQILPMSMARHGSELTMIKHYSDKMSDGTYISGVKLVFKDHTVFCDSYGVDTNAEDIIASVAISTSSDERNLKPSDWHEYHFKKTEMPKVSFTESITNAMNLMNVELKFDTDNKVNFYIDGKIEERIPDVYYSEHNGRITVALDPEKLMQSGSNPEPDKNKLPMIRICVTAPYDESTDTSVLLFGNRGEKYGVTWN